MSGVFDGGFNSQTLTDAADPLVVHRCIVITRQIVSDASVTLIRTLLVNLLHLSRDASVLRGTRAEFPRVPLVITGSGNREEPTQRFYRIPLFL